jgi:hypothetical protein
MTIPSYLKKGDTIGITCPAGYMYADKAQTCIETLQQWGYQVMVGKTLGSDSTNYFSGTDQERADELQAMLDDPNIKIALTPDSPSSDLMLLVTDKFNFVNLRPNGGWMVKADGSQDAIQRLVKGEVQAAVAWEPDISRVMKENPGKYVVIASSKDFADRIVDVLLVNSKFLRGNREGGGEPSQEVDQAGWIDGLAFAGHGVPAALEELGSGDIEAEHEVLPGFVAGALGRQNAASFSERVGASRAHAALTGRIATRLTPEAHATGVPARKLLRTMSTPQRA